MCYTDIRKTNHMYRYGNIFITQIKFSNRGLELVSNASIRKHQAWCLNTKTLHQYHMESKQISVCYWNIEKKKSYIYPRIIFGGKRLWLIQQNLCFILGFIIVCVFVLSRTSLGHTKLLKRNYGMKYWSNWNILTRRKCSTF